MFSLCGALTEGVRESEKATFYVPFIHRNDVAEGYKRVFCLEMCLLTNMSAGLFSPFQQHGCIVREKVIILGWKTGLLNTLLNGFWCISAFY